MWHLHYFVFFLSVLFALSPFPVFVRPMALLLRLSCFVPFGVVVVGSFASVVLVSGVVVGAVVGTVVGAVVGTVVGVVVDSVCTVVGVVVASVPAFMLPERFLHPVSRTQIAAAMKK